MPPIVVAEEEVVVATCVATEMATSVVGTEDVVAEDAATKFCAKSVGKLGTLPCAATSILMLITMVKRNRCMLRPPVIVWTPTGTPIPCYGPHHFRARQANNP
jgi:hypothetical protein